MKNRTKIPNIYLGIILCLMYLPILIVIIYSFNTSKSTATWGGFTFDWYFKLANNRTIRRALTNSLVLATISSLSAAVIGTFAAVGLPKVNFLGKKGIEYISMLPIMIPEVILGIVFVAYFKLMKIPMGMPALCIAHISFCIPYIYSQVSARLVGLDPSLVEAARDLGASQRKAFSTVTLPAIMPAVLSGTMLAFAMSMDDVVISVFLTNASINTLPLFVYTQVKTEPSPEINALCAIMLLATLLIVVISGLVKRIGNTNKKTNT